MIEFGIILGVAAVALALCAYFARSTLARTGALKSSASLLGSTQTAVRTYLRLLLRVLGPLTALCALLLFVGLGLVRAHKDTDPSASSLVWGGWLTLSFLFGCACTLAVAHGGPWLTLRLTPKLLIALKTSSAEALGVALRGGALLSFVSLGLSLLGLTFLSVLAFSLSGGFHAQGLAQWTAASCSAQLVLGYAAGACFMSVLLGLFSGLFLSGARLSAPWLGPPGALWLLVGKNLKQGGLESVEALACSASGMTAAALLMTRLAPHQAQAWGPTTALLAFPLLSGAFGLLASAVGLLVVRTDAQEPAQQALSRGLYVTLVLLAASYVGLCKWLFEEHWGWVFGAASCGLACALLLHLLWQHEQRATGGSMRVFFSALRHSPALGLLQGLASGLQRSALLLLLGALALLIGYALGHGSGLESGGWLGLVACTLGLLAPAPYLLACSSTSSLLDCVQPLPPSADASCSEPAERAARLWEATSGYSSETRLFGALASAFIALVLGYAYGHLVPAAAEHAVRTGALPEPSTFRLGAIALGTTAVLGFCALTLRTLTRLALAVQTESSEQSASDKTDEGAPSSEVSTLLLLFLQDTLRQGLALGLGTVALPLVLGVVARLITSRWGLQLSVETTRAFVTSTALVGGALALALEGTGSSWSAGRYHGWLLGLGAKTTVDEAAKRAKNPAYSAAAVSDTLGDPLRQLASSSLPALVKLLATITVALAPLFY